MRLCVPSIDLTGEVPTIGVFDSGVGGLTVLRAIHAALPSFHTVYLGDTARVPYGTRSPDTIVRYAINAAMFLARSEPLSALVIACNTASAVALEAVTAAVNIPVIGVVEPTAKGAVEASRSQRIGVIGTAGTIRSGAYQRAVHALSPNAQTFAVACPLLVPLAEEGWSDRTDPVVQQIVARYLAPFQAHNIDTLILGCTHYPLLHDALSAFLGPNVVLADGGKSVASALLSRFGPQPSTGGPPATRRYFVTDVPHAFRTVLERFMDSEIPDPIQVDL